MATGSMPSQTSELGRRGTDHIEEIFAGKRHTSRNNIDVLKHESSSEPATKMTNKEPRVNQGMIATDEIQMQPGVRFGLFNDKKEAESNGDEKHEEGFFQSPRNKGLDTAAEYSESIKSEMTAGVHSAFKGYKCFCES